MHDFKGNLKYNPIHRNPYKINNIFAINHVTWFVRSSADEFWLKEQAKTKKKKLELICGKLEEKKSHPFEELLKVTKKYYQTLIENDDMIFNNPYVNFNEIYAGSLSQHHFLPIPYNYIKITFDDFLKLLKK